MGEIFAESVREHPEFLELVTPPSLSLSVFRIAPRAVPVLSAGNLNDLNELYYRRLNERNDLMLTQTELNGAHCVRYEGSRIPRNTGTFRLTFLDLW